jgi:hypothetical protein
MICFRTAKFRASMRPRRGTPWKGRTPALASTHGSRIDLGCFNAATEGNSVERPKLDRRRTKYCSMDGFNAATEGNSVERRAKLGPVPARL